MAEYDGATENEATGFSGFGGHQLVPQDDMASAVAAYGEGGDSAVATLNTLGIEDAEQVIAIAAIPEARGELQSALGMKNKDLQRFLEQVQSPLPADRVALVNTPAPKDLGLGVLPMTPEMTAAAEASAMELVEAVSLPAAMNLIPFMQPIRNQGPRGTCVAFTLTALREYILRRRGILQNMSEQHLYYETKLIDGAPGLCGTWQVRAVTVLQARGQCREPLWPYNINPPCNNHGALPAVARPDGLRYRIATLAVPPRNVIAYKTHLSAQRPVTLSIPVYNSWYQSAETRRSGRITMRIGNESRAGGHAVCLVGYQDSPSSPGGGYFIVRNSWNTTWAYQSPYSAGYGTIPYQYITNEAMEAFTAVVPGVTGEEEKVVDEGQTGTATTVTLEVNPNIKITITTS